MILLELYGSKINEKVFLEGSMNSIQTNRNDGRNLIEGLKANEPHYQRLFWKRYWPDVYGISACILGDGFPAREVATGVLSDFLSQCVHRLVHAQAMWSYLRLMTVRRAKKEKTILDGLEQNNIELLVDDSDFSAEQKADVKLLLPRLEECLGRLTPKAQQVLKLRYNGDLPNEKIGDLLGGSKQYIGRLITQCHEMLRKCLEKGRIGLSQLKVGGFSS